MKTLFVTDLDGTLLTKEERVSEYSRGILNRLIEGGLMFTYATARSALSAEKALEGVHIKLPAVLYNGGLILDPVSRKTLDAVFFSEEEKLAVYTVLRTHDIYPFVYSAAKSERRERVCWLGGSETSGMKRYLERRREDGRLFSVSTEEELLSERIFYFKCIGSREKLEVAWNILKYDPRFICIFHQETYHSDFWMEISPRESTKANGVKKIKQLLGADKVVCFGDTSNDSDMFDVCDEKYAVMNADDWLKHKATGVIGYCEEDGVAKWLEAHAEL